MVSFARVLANSVHIDYVARCPDCGCGGCIVWDRHHDVFFCSVCGFVLFEGGCWCVDLDVVDVDDVVG